MRSWQGPGSVSRVPGTGETAVRGSIKGSQPFIEQLIAALTDHGRRLGAEHFLLRGVLAERDERGEDVDERPDLTLAVAGAARSGERLAGVVERAARVAEPQQGLCDSAQALRLDSPVSRAVQFALRRPLRPGGRSTLGGCCYRAAPAM